MSLSPEPKQEHPSTYMVQDRSNQEEMLRLQKQDLWTTLGMGGVLAEQPDPEKLRRVLDVGCGTGGWLLETARLYPQIKPLVGVDISKRMLQFATEQAEAQQLAERVEFRVMDALRMLEFPTDFFDLVNVRLATGWLRTWDWPKFLDECRRVCRPGGVVRVTEGSMAPHSNSPALNRLLGFYCTAHYQSGHLFTPDGGSLIQELPKMLERFGLLNIQVHEHAGVTRAGTEEWQFFYENMRLLFRTISPFLQKWLRLPDDYQEICQQMLSELQQPDFEATALVRTVWGNTPSSK